MFGKLPDRPTLSGKVSTLEKDHDPFVSSYNPALHLDEFDRKILHQLQVDASLPAEAIGEKIGLSRNACWRRIKRLEDEGAMIIAFKLVRDGKFQEEGITEILQSPGRSRYSCGYAIQCSLPVQGSFPTRQLDHFQTFSVLRFPPSFYPFAASALTQCNTPSRLTAMHLAVWLLGPSALRSAQDDNQ